MNRRWMLTLVAALFAALASPAAAAPAFPTLDQHQDKVERVAPPFPTVPAKTLCVCQTADNSGTTSVGYLNSFLHNQGGDFTVNLVCTYPVYSSLGNGSFFCARFEVIK